MVEAKRESLSYAEGVRQAKDYAQRLQCRIAYASNGHDIYQIDMQTGEEALVAAYLSPDALWTLTFAEHEPDYTTIWRKRFAAIPLETKGGGWLPRYYQENAINNVLEHIAQGDTRILLTLATGTGKTAIAFQIAWKLFQSAKPAPGACSICDQRPCRCEKTTPEPCSDCGQRPCICEKIEIKLSDGKVRQIQHISAVMYWSAEGAPITAKEFIERMFADLPQFFADEDQLREIWSDPSTREKLLHDLSESGYDAEKLDSMKALLDAKESDVYDVLAHVAYATETRSRLERVKQAIAKAFVDYKQQQFIAFILEKYIAEGVQELAPKKMRGLIELKYNTISDAAVELGSIPAIRDTFVGFQKHLYAAS